jgi:hypothetical protein
MSFIEDRPISYDPTKTYKLSTETWISEELPNGGRFKQSLIVISDEGEVLFGEI